ncbi:hypothetical protein [uncultured Polaribacter sp.]|uniref:hypothetical protein n=1 Tax=uncultured Polaribacter sp. TaxID=174711 RepID=UPI0026194995|nr:hypothetical protein [uncultured Polaribacter sp.]
MRNFIIFFFLLISIQITEGQDYLDEGLSFYSHEVIQEKRTSLNLTPKTPIRFQKKINISFEANFRRGDGYYGNILKIVGNSFLNIDLVANLDSNEENFWLVIKDKILFSYKWSDIPKGDYNRWIKFNINIDVEKSTIALSINNEKIVKKSDALKDISNLEMIFGKSLHTKFQTTDVCPMSIKNVKIFNQNGKMIRNWSLGMHTKNNVVYDNIIKDVAIAKNPEWLIDQHLFWKKQKDFNFNRLLGTAKDLKGERVFFIESEKIHIYSLVNRTLETIIVKENFIKCQSNKFFFNNTKEELVAYSIDEQTFNLFNFKDSSWLNPETKCKETSYLHHTIIADSKNSSLITFGGYGFYRYNSSFNKFNINDSSFSTATIDNEITPRYLSSSGIIDANKFLIFGGYGSKSGRQGVNSRFFYDLYAVDFNSLKPKKIWSLENESSESFLPVKSLIVDNISESFFTLIFNNTNYKTHLKLVRFGIKNKEKQIYPDSIPYNFLDVKSDAFFFLNYNKSKLYTITTTDQESSLYSMTYPPLLANDVYQEEKENSAFNFSKNIWILGLIVAMIFLALYVLKNRKQPVISTEKVIAQEESLDLIAYKKEKIKKSAVYLFGGFQVYDKGGNDITALFTPTLKQLFILILLSSSKNNKGISSIKLTEYLWPNKPESNARNNRNVNISKLKILLEKIGDIKINNENTYWFINIGPSAFCDYNFVTKLLSEGTNANLDKDEVYELLEIVSRGEISPDIQTDWIEDFKMHISNLLIDNLNRIAKNQSDLRLLILIGDTILKYGPLNEEAIALKCKSLYLFGKKGLAKQQYNQFCKTYFEVLDSKYDVTFKEIIN